MKKIDLEDVSASLKNMQHKIEVPEETRNRAKHALDGMLEI